MPADIYVSKCSRSANSLRPQRQIPCQLMASEAQFMLSDKTLLVNITQILHINITHKYYTNITHKYRTNIAQFMLWGKTLLESITKFGAYLGWGSNAYRPLY